MQIDNLAWTLKPADPCFPVSATEGMVSRLTTSRDLIVTRPSLPTLDVVKFSCDPREYFRFKARAFMK